MRYEDVIPDIENLIGQRLNSLRPGAEITIRRVDHQDGRIELETTNGTLKTRPLSELQKIWEQLCEKPAVHVDSILGGSGSSRNQPETILANLPYIEWFRINGKKHIAFVGSPTHKLGTLKQMDTIDIEEIRQRLREDITASKYRTVVVIADDINQASCDLENITGLPVKPLEPGIYVLDHKDVRILLVLSNKLGTTAKTGTYLVIEATALSVPKDCMVIQVAGQELYVLDRGGMHLLLAIS